MILVCGATGDLGGRVVRLLAAQGREVRALVRPGTDASELEAEGVEVVRGDLREEGTLGPALAGVDTVVTTANAVTRVLEGSADLTIKDVDDAGNRNLVRAADEAGVQRFVFVSVAGLSEEEARRAPLAAAKLATERALHTSSMQVVIVRPDMFQEVWLSPVAGIDAAAGKAMVYGRGETPHRYVAMDDVAALCAHLAVAHDPPGLVEFGGPEALTRTQVVAAFDAATGRKLKVQHVPRPVLAVASRLLAVPKPALASLMGMALHSDSHPSTWDDAPLRAVGVEPRAATTYINQTAAALR
ncbi:SDR family oxidoreductase [Ornithinimicrobium sp. LYQ103]|uniref:SDR family oxidoreductase n=1 Tax=Ornithinimicrobium sp. LYQ103 TaxID=3378796 RepID=UPI003852AF06